MTIEMTTTDSQEIYNSVMNMLQDGVDEPLYPGDERRIFAEAMVTVLASAFSTLNDVSRQKMLAYARSEVLDALGERVLTPRLIPEHARCTIRFAIDEPQQTGIVIPVGTKVTADSAVYFATAKTAVLTSGNVHVDVEAVAVEGGAAGNQYPPESANTLVNIIPHISSVTNLDQSHGGDDGEPYTDEGDNRYRERIRLAPTRFSTAGPISGYEYWALSADPSIKAVSVTSPNPGEVVIIPFMLDGTIPDEEVLKKVEKACSADDVRPMTDLVRAQAPEPVEYDIEIVYYTTVTNEPNCIKTIEGSGGAIEQYISEQSGRLGLDISPDLLRRFVLRPDWETGLVGALRLDVIAPAFKLLSDTQIAQFSGNLKISHEVVSP